MDLKKIDENLFLEIRTLVESARGRVSNSVNFVMVETYYQIGQIIVSNEQMGKKRAEYGAETIKNISKKLTSIYGKGFTVRNLELMRKFYLVYGKTKTLFSNLEEGKNMKKEGSENRYFSNLNLSWSHYIFLMRLDEKERGFYEIEAAKNNWSLRELKRQFNSGLYERLSLSKNKSKVRKLSKEGQVVSKPIDAIKEPYILEFLGLDEKAKYTENELEQAIIDKLEHFLLELGKGFTFVARQKRISIKEKHFYIDLVFYHRLLQCFVIIDLKIGEIKHQDLGQMQMYVNYYDRYVKEEAENATIGIVLCKDKDDTLVEITLPEKNKQIFASKYKLYLPSKEDLKLQLEKIDLKK